MMKTICILALFVALAYGSPQPVVFAKNTVGDVWSDCSKPGDPAKIGRVVITPDPPKKGQNVAVNASFTLSEEVTGGSIKVSLKYGIFTVYSGTLDLCDTIKGAGLKCPLATGAHTVSVTEAVPSVAPSGHYTGKVEVTDQAGKELGCGNIDMHLS